MIFKSDLVLNVLHLLISSIFISSVLVRNSDDDYVPLQMGGMFESAITFDVSSDRIFETYFSRILNSFNSASAGSGSTSDNKSKKYTKSFKSTSSTGGSPLKINNNTRNGSQDTPSGVRSYSSLNRGNRYEICYNRKGIEFLISFPSFDELKLFFNNEIKNF
jgi:acetaldehyde dehydrogenase (acetylating)